MGFSRQEYRSRLSCPSPGDLPNRDRTHVCSVSYIYRVSLVAQLTESAYNARDPSSIPGSGRSPGEGNGYPLQYSWAYLVAQMVKHPPAMQETWVWSPDWEDPLEEGMGTYSSILAWRIPMDRGAWCAAGHGITKSRTQLSDSAQCFPMFETIITLRNTLQLRTHIGICFIK